MCLHFEANFSGKLCTKFSATLHDVRCYFAQSLVVIRTKFCATSYRAQAISKGNCFDLISALHTNNCTDPDNILKSVASVIAPPLTDINSSLSSGCFPSTWKQTCVEPLHKDGDKAELTNYHPISLLPINSTICPFPTSHTPRRERHCSQASD